jgi:hypothetical protein
MKSSSRIHDPTVAQCTTKAEIALMTDAGNATIIYLRSILGGLMHLERRDD